MPQLQDLPAEILINILLYLHFIDLFSVKQTCRRLSDVVLTSSLLKYQAELQISGMYDNPFSQVPIPIRLGMLKEREDAWMSLIPKFEQKLPVPHKTVGLYDVTPGLYLLGKEEDDLTTRAILAARLPHYSDQSSPALDWDPIHFDATVLDFATSIEENDLLACVTLARSPTGTSLISIILRRFSTHELYDGISSPVISVDEYPASHGRPHISIEISGENLVFILMFERRRPPQPMFIYDWKTGKRKSETIAVFGPGLVFLREDILVHPEMQTSCLNIYYIPSSSSTESVRLIRVLDLPFLKLNRHISFIACRGDPSPTANSSFPKNTPHRRPYANNPEEAIIVFALQISSDVGVEPASHFVMIVHRKALLSLVLDFLSPTVPFNVAGVPWNMWGPPVTRWIPVNPISINYITLSAGQRFVELSTSRHEEDDDDEDEDEDEDDWDLRVLDFNPWHVRLARANGIPQQSRIQVVGGPSRPSDDNMYMSTNTADEDPSDICPGGTSFARDIISRLPFVRSSSAEMCSCDGMLIDEERLIGLRSRYDFTAHTSRLESLDVFYFG